EALAVELQEARDDDGRVVRGLLADAELGVETGGDDHGLLLLRLRRLRRRDGFPVAVLGEQASRQRVVDLDGCAALHRLGSRYLRDDDLVEDAHVTDLHGSLLSSAAASPRRPG